MSNRKDLEQALYFRQGGVLCPLRNGASIKTCPRWTVPKSMGQGACWGSWHTCWQPLPVRLRLPLLLLLLPLHCAGKLSALFGTKISPILPILVNLAMLVHLDHLHHFNHLCHLHHFTKRNGASGPSSASGSSGERGPSGASGHAGASSASGFWASLQNLRVNFAPL